MNGFEDANFYLPHRRPMLFIEQVESVDEEKVVCRVSTAPDGALSIALNPDGSLDAYFLMEIMAQTVGVWAGFFRNEAQKAKSPQDDPDADIGMLLSIRSARFFIDKIRPSEEISISMNKLFQDGRVATFEGSAQVKGTEAARGRLTVYQPKCSELEKLFCRKS